MIIYFQEARDKHIRLYFNQLGYVCVTASVSAAPVSHG